MVVTRKTTINDGTVNLSKHSLSTTVFTHDNRLSLMFYTASYSRYAAELALFALFAFLGVFLNSQTMVALGILVLAHCLPSLLLATLRHLFPRIRDNKTTLYSNSICSFREKETIMLISSSLIIGLSVGLLVLSLQKLTFIPPFSTDTLLMLGGAYILIETLLYCSANIKYKLKNSEVRKPLPSRIIRMVVASLMMIIAMIELEWLQTSLDSLTGLAVLLYLMFTSLTTLIDIARKNTTYAPGGIDVEDVKSFILDLPGVEQVNKVYFRRSNETEHELGVRLSLAPFIQNNTVELTDQIRSQITKAYGTTSVSIELVRPEPEKVQTAPPPSDYSVILLGSDET